MVIWLKIIVTEMAYAETYNALDEDDRHYSLHCGITCTDGIRAYIVIQLWNTTAQTDA